MSSLIITFPNNCHVWESTGDALPYWVSDSEGYELEAFTTIEQAIECAKKQGYKMRDKYKEVKIVKNPIGYFHELSDEYFNTLESCQADIDYQLAKQTIKDLEPVVNSLKAKAAKLIVETTEQLTLF